MAYRNKQLSRYRVSRKDVVPDDYFSIDDIMRSNTIHESKETISLWKKSTISNVLLEMDKEYCVDIRKWWYTHINDPSIEVPYGSDVIWFMKNMYLAKVVKLIEVFVESKPRKFGKYTRDLFYISFGIKKEFFKRYFTSHGKDVPKVQNTTKKPEGKLNPDTRITIDKNSRHFVKTKRLPELQRWKDWCKLNNVSQSDAILFAMCNQIDENPTEGLPDISSYTQDTVTLVKNGTSVGTVACRVSRPELDRAKEIIRAYNKKHGVDIKGEMTIARYLSLAAKMLNDVMENEYLEKENIESMKDEINKIDEQIKKIESIL